MGMTTSLIFDAKLKPDWVPLIQDLYGIQLARVPTILPVGEFSPWQALVDYHKLKFNWLQCYAALPRSGSIPFGCACYNSDVIQCPTDENWHVGCGFKNYNEEVQIFLGTVLPKLIAEPCRAEYEYEEWDAPMVVNVEPVLCEVWQ